MQYGSCQSSRLPNAVIQDDIINWSPLHSAAATGDERKVEALLAGAVDLTLKESKHGNTPLHEAALHGFSRCVKLLCTQPVAQQSQKLEQKDKDKKKIKKKFKSEAHENREMIRNLMLNIKNHEGSSALHLAAQNGHNQSCRELLWAGADPDIQNYYGDTALHTACRYGHAGATRIILSASCDANKVNLNGDSALHISVAMGKRKLTRILLEAHCDVYIKNAQLETPCDIALRKNYGEVLDILNYPELNRRVSEGKSTPISSSDDRSFNKITWSPYGCHYFPDPRSFPAPKLETLPKEPLREGEQYYLDLAGNIHKGPVSKGHTCYCGPFFQHIEDNINLKNRRKLNKYIRDSKESSLDSNLQEEWMHSTKNDEAEQNSPVVEAYAERHRHHRPKHREHRDEEHQSPQHSSDLHHHHDKRRVNIDYWLRRGEPFRLTSDSNKRERKTMKNQQHTIIEDDGGGGGTLTRCRSLELLQNGDVRNDDAPTLANAKSFDMLDNTLPQSRMIAISTIATPSTSTPQQSSATVVARNGVAGGSGGATAGAVSEMIKSYNRRSAMSLFTTLGLCHRAANGNVNNSNEATLREEKKILPSDSEVKAMEVQHHANNINSNVGVDITRRVMLTQHQHQHHQQQQQRIYHDEIELCAEHRMQQQHQKSQKCENVHTLLEEISRMTLNANNINNNNNNNNNSNNNGNTISSELGYA